MPQAQPFDNPTQFEPLFPERDLAALKSRAQRIVEASLRLTTKAHPTTIDRLRERLRAMNSYYTNRIEGQGTHPLNIERAMASDYSQKPEVAKLQRLALAHIEAAAPLD